MVDTRLSETLANFDGHQDQEQLAGVERELTDLRERLATVSDHLQSKMEPVMTALQEQLKEGVDTRLEQDLTDLKDRVEALPGLLDSRMSEALADLSRQPTEDPGQLAEVERRLGDLRDHLVGLGSQLEAVPGMVDTRLSETIAEMSGQPAGDRKQLGEVERRLGDLRDHLVGLGSQLEAFTGEMDKRMSATPADFNGHQDPEQVAGVQRQLNDLSEQLSAVAMKLERGLEPAVDGSPAEREEIEAGLTQMQSEFKAQIEAMTQQVSEQVSEALADLEAPAPTSKANDRVSKQLKALIDRLDERLSTAPEDSAGPQGQEQIAGLERQLAAVGEHVAAVLDRQNEIEPALAALREAHGKPDQDGFKLAQAMADVQAKLEAVTEQVDKRFSEMLADLESRVAGPQNDERTQQQLSALIDRLESLQSSLSGLETAGRSDGAADSGLDGKLDDLQAQLNTATELMEKRMTEVLEALEAARGDVADASPPQASRKRPAKKAKPREPEQLVKLLIDAISSGNEHTIRKFVTEEYSESALTEGGVEPRVDVYQSVYSESGALRLINLEQTGENALVAIVQSMSSPLRQRFEIMREPTPPHKIQVVNIEDV